MGTLNADQLFVGNCLTVAKTLHWLDDLCCNRTMTPTPTPLKLHVKHTKRAQQQGCVRLLVALLNLEVAFTEFVKSDLTRAFG